MYIFMVKSTINPKYKEKIINYYFNGHLHEVVATGCFKNWTCEYDLDSHQIIVRYECESEEKFNIYLEQYAPKFREETKKMFPNEILKVDRNFSKIMSESIRV